jgi:hypothetical protein
MWLEGIEQENIDDVIYDSMNVDRSLVPGYVFSSFAREV